MLGNHQQLLLRNNRSSITYRQQGAVQADTQLVTQHLDNGKPAFNTLIVPYGNTASLVLEDGTRVWLNAGSRLVYPAAFAAKKREVFLEGEAYFDVRPSAGQPFSVYTSDLEVKVLGTAFNVTAYRDDAGQQVVLTSGSVALEAHKGPAVRREQKQLSPGNMAAYSPGAGDITVKDVRTEEYVSWKDGHIRALHTPLEDILKKLSRYYNQPIQVNSQQGKETFSGDLDLQKNLTDVLSIVAATTSMQYEKSGNTIVLKNKP
jgi:ferric-dicitrate binding protein FerR (iron transport regulator)